MPKIYYYAVIKGRQSGIFDKWAQCQDSVKGYSGAKFKKFKTRQEAEYFLTAGLQNPGQSSSCSSGVDIVHQIIQTSAITPSEKSLADKYGIVLDASSCSLKNTKENKELANKDLCILVDDKEDDKDLVRALSALEEYPDNTVINQSININKRKRKTDQCKNNINTEPKRIKFGLYNFLMDEMGFVNVYISGYCKNIGSWNGIAGFGVYFDNKHPLNKFEAATGRMTHNVGDIEAAIFALKEAKKYGIQKICINTSSEFLLKAVTSWMPFWKNNGWRNKSGKIVQNRKQIEQLDGLLRDENIEAKWKNVKGDRSVVKEMREVLKMAELGAEEYLELHPSKDLDSSFDYDFDYF